MTLKPRLVLPTVLFSGLIAIAVSAQPPAPGGREGRFAAGPPVHPVVQALDADGDGEISAKEIDNAPAALRTLDKGKNGKLSGDEIRPAFGRSGGREGRAPDPAELVTRMMAFDKDGDGKLSQAELPERMKALVETADVNKDGFIDKEELTKLAVEQSRTAREDRPGRRGDAAPPGPGTER
ncbi:MAG: EF-hand domain-containing protein [Isosphaeraceae bacterium]|nr:EF-hand domain-containing protein [Isosphaeraceae bacterium]